MNINIEIIDKVIELAECRIIANNIYTNKFFKNGIINFSEYDKHIDSQEYKMYQVATKELLLYLNSLDFDTIKELQILMYMGRDEANNKLDGITIFNQYYEEFEKRWNTKEIEINQIMEKMPLADYLKNGKQIVGL